MNKKTRKQTLRQRLRVDAETRLNEIIKQAYDAIDKVKGSATIKSTDVMRLCGGGDQKTLRNNLIGKLVDDAEAELVKIYNAQKAEESDQ